jgi:NAD(P)H-hydrate repair Nnr-like enzyme with NAD(P)H-hydrate epimerase domain
MWHTLQKKYAISPSQPQKKSKSSFSYLVLDFIEQLYEPSQIMRIAILCGDAQRFPEIFELIQYASDLEWQLDIYLIPSLEKKWQAFIKKLEAVVPIFLTPNLLENNHYTLMIDCIAPIGNDVLSSEHLDIIKSSQALPAQKISLDIPSGLNPDTGDSRNTLVFSRIIHRCCKRILWDLCDFDP